MLHVVKKNISKALERNHKLLFFLVAKSTVFINITTTTKSNVSLMNKQLKLYFSYIFLFCLIKSYLTQSQFKNNIFGQKTTYNFNLRCSCELTLS